MPPAVAVEDPHAVTLLSPMVSPSPIPSPNEHQHEPTSVAGVAAEFAAAAVPAASPPAPNASNDSGKGGAKGGKGGKGGKGPPPRGKGGGATPTKAFVMPARVVDPKKAEKKQGKAAPMDFQAELRAKIKQREEKAKVEPRASFGVPMVRFLLVLSCGGSLQASPQGDSSPGAAAAFTCEGV